MTELKQKAEEFAITYGIGDNFNVSEFIDFAVKFATEEIATLKHNKKTVAHLSSCLLDVQEKKIADLEKENLKVKQACHKWFMRWREAKKDALYFDSSLQKQIEATLKLQQENSELKDYNKKLLQSDIDKQNKIVLLSKKVNDLQKEFVLPKIEGASI